MDAKKKKEMAKRNKLRTLVNKVYAKMTLKDAEKEAKHDK